MKVVILQPSYIPWRGYFHQIQKSDLFVFYDCVQYDDRGWRNRNLIRSKQGFQWLTIPVNSKGHQSQTTPIKDIPIAWETDWTKKHFSSLRHNYTKAPFFADYAPLLEEFYARRDDTLADFTCELTVALARTLGLTQTKFLRSSTLRTSGTKSMRLLSILKQLGATHYISGPSARDYIDLAVFSDAGIEVEFIKYDYPAYRQIHGGFEPNVSILDLLFNLGPGAPCHIWGPTI